MLRYIILSLVLVFMLIGCNNNNSDNHDNINDINSVNSDGNKFVILTLNRITTNLGTDWMPSWSPDGSKIVYVSSPKIIESFGDNTQDIYTISATGGTPTKITTYNGVDGYKPKYSPDGNDILYATTMNSQGLGLWTIDEDGGKPTKIYDSFANDVWASWSPDGTQIVFYTEETKPTRLDIISANGNGLRTLPNPYEYYCPHWSPNGSTIITHSSRTGNHDLFEIAVADGSATQLTNTSWAEHLAEFSPDGRWIAFGSDRTGKAGLWVMSASGGEQILLVDDLGLGELHPSWSPDGTKIAFHRTNGANYYNTDIWVLSGLPKDFTK